MPKSSQIIPEHSYPHQMVVINDNSKVSATPSSDSGETNMLFVFASPKGEDGKLHTVDGGMAQFLEDYGIGPFSIYGQPLLNAYNAVSAGVVAHCLRVCADNAAYANSNLIAKYKVEVSGAMTVKFQAVGGSAALSSLDNLDEIYTPATEPDVDGYTEVKLLSVAPLGKGKYGDSLAWRIGSLTTADKENDYKNYLFEMYDATTGFVKKEEFSVAFDEDAIVDENSIFSDSVINDPDSGSDKIKIVTYVEGFKQIVDAYNAANVGSVLTVADFDVLLGINKYTKAAIANYTIDTVTAGTIAVNSLTGVSFVNGSDGDFSAATAQATRQTALDAAYTKAFSGLIDPMIKSKNKFPTNIILDANYPLDVKKLILALGTTRKDCMVIVDCGTGITTKQSVATYVKENLDSFANDRVQMIDAYCGKVKDPFSKKIVTVTSTYGLVFEYAANFEENGGKHVPFAGNSLGVLSGYIKNSIYPVFDEDIDSDMMDELADENINFARINAVQDVIRATQATRQNYKSNLSEANNVFTVLDIKRDSEKLCATYDYNFSEPTDIARFNKDMEPIVATYDATQVKSVTAGFDKNDWEADRGILHLYIGLVHKDLVKTSIIEIDVNRG